MIDTTYPFLWEFEIFIFATKNMPEVVRLRSFFQFRNIPFCSYHIGKTVECIFFLGIRAPFKPSDTFNIIISAQTVTFIPFAGKAIVRVSFLDKQKGIVRIQTSCLALDLKYYTFLLIFDLKASYKPLTWFALLSLI